MSGVLFVPVRLDALWAGKDQTLVGPSADFSRLPYFDGERDVNPAVAHVGEEIVSRPFENQTFRLKAGVHLHWALPDALTRGKAQTDGTHFPAVPDRWLVIRSRTDAQGNRAEEKRWVVESDYLHPDGEGDASGGVSVPHEPAAGERRPFRFLGRRVDFADWKKVSPKARYFKPLTAVGYGEPSFAAFYPNCHSVFGLYDADHPGEPPAGLRYDLFGWYGADTLDGATADDDGRDFFGVFVEGARKRYANADSSRADAVKLIASLEKELGWTISPADVVRWYRDAQKAPADDYLRQLMKSRAAREELPSAGEFIKGVAEYITKSADEELLNKVGPVFRGEFPSQMLCYASLTFDTSGGVLPNPSASDTNTAVAVGNTGTEALSAFLARSISVEHKAVIEDQLEALFLSPQLGHRQLDVGFKFREARHERGFMAVSGGLLWTVTQETAGGPAPANAPDAEPLRQITLPPEIAHQLNTINALQQQYDQSRQQIQARRTQLFSDWHKYMRCAYPPVGSTEDYPDPDEVKNYIEINGIAPLQRAVAATGELLLLDRSGAVTDARASDTSVHSLAATLAAAVKELLKALEFDTNPALAGVLKYKLNDSTLLTLKRLPGARVREIRPERWRSVEGLRREAPKGKTEFLSLLFDRLGFEVSEGKEVAEILAASQATFYRLRLKPGPRFWRPNEPVVLLSGAAAEASGRHGQDGRLRDDGLLVCHVLPHEDLKDLVPSNFPALTDMLERIRPAARGGDGFAFNVWRQNPWNPLLLEWEVKVFPAEAPDAPRQPGEGYSPSFIGGSYALGQDAVDLTYRPGGGTLAKEANVYVGSNILTPHAGLKFGLELERFFVEFMRPDLLERFFTEQKVAPADRHETYLTRHFRHLFAWYVNQSDVIRQYGRDCDAASEAGDIAPPRKNSLRDYFTWSLERADAKKRFYDEQKTPDENRNGSYLSEHAGQFIAWLKPQIYDLARFYADTNVPDERRTDAYLQRHLDQLVAWYQLEIQRAIQMVVMAEAHRKLAGSNYLSQSLGGFNAALLMHRQTMQLPVSDPLGFKEYQDFARGVRDAVLNATTSAPDPSGDFSPVRSGAMQLNRLRLVDTFGQVLDVSCETVTTTNLLTTPGSEHLLTIPPRLVQPARLNFRWLSAAHGDAEMNDHPAATPVCGWVLPNNLDNSLMVYDGDGRALGSVSPLAGWRPAPGQAAVSPGEIGNEHLQKMVKHLIAQGEAFLDDFISTVNSALDGIEPENFAQHQGMALLVGRPLALVRATLGWELQGAPAVNQSWEAFRRDLNRGGRATDNFTRVQFPVRVGEYRQLNDGVVGYWKEFGDTYEGGVFYAPQSHAVGSDRIRTHADVKTEADAPVAINLAPDSPPQTIALLLDPRGNVHATTGIVPTKAINIPPDMYKDALHNIQVTFLSAPILTDLGEIRLPLPAKTGYRWAWLQKEGAAWSETSAIGAASAEAEFNGRQEVREGWLKLIALEEGPTST